MRAATTGLPVSCTSERVCDPRDGETARGPGGVSVGVIDPSEPTVFRIGAAIPLVLLNQFVLLPVTEWLKINVGDYVPAGAVGETLGATAIITVLSAVVLAPFVEESLYRGYATSRLRARFGPLTAFLIVMVFFGLLHWAQGLWSMVYTMVAHAIFAGLILWRRNLYAAWMTHLLFNAVELALLLL